jgi:carboxyl-terminal processing protease
MLNVRSLGPCLLPSLLVALAAAPLASAAPQVAKPAPAAPAKRGEKSAERYENLELFQKVLHFVEANYVDEVKNKELMYGAIKGMLETLDPHSNFLPPDVYRDMKIDTSGEFGGLGIEIGLKDNVLTVIAPIEDTPAWNAGIQPGDRIVKINGESTKGMNLMEAISRMRGKQGTEVRLTVFQGSTQGMRDFKLLRDKVKIQAVKSEMVEPGYGYIRLTNFNENSTRDMSRHLDRLEKDGKLKGLVFDLRSNPGGLLDQAVEVSSLFINDPNAVIVSTIQRNRNEKTVKHALSNPKARTELPLAILVNSSTASAAEIVAGALQDHHRAIVMGQTTFGKGSVQSVIDLGQEMGLKLTIARYYTPSGRSIQEKGVKPDVLLEDFDPKLLAEARRKNDGVRERDLKGHMKNADSDEFELEELRSLGKAETPAKAEPAEAGGDSKPLVFKAREDYQVQEAINHLKSFDVFQRIAARQGALREATGRKAANEAAPATAGASPKSP